MLQFIVITAVCYRCFSLCDIEPGNYSCCVAYTAINKQIHKRTCAHTYIGRKQYVKIRVQRLAAVPY